METRKQDGANGRAIGSTATAYKKGGPTREESAAEEAARRGARFTGEGAGISPHLENQPDFSRQAGRSALRFLERKGGLQRFPQKARDILRMRVHVS